MEDEFNREVAVSNQRKSDLTFQWEMDGVTILVFSSENDPRCAGRFTMSALSASAETVSRHSGNGARFDVCASQQVAITYTIGF